MHRDEIARLASIADAVRGARGKPVDLGKWQEPKHAHLLRAPAALVDGVMAELSDDGTAGDPLPWPKMDRTLRLRPHEFTVWGGANGSAKSTLLSEIMVALATAGSRVVVVSLEMPAVRVAARMVVQAFCNRHPARRAVEDWAEDIGDRLTFLDWTGDIEPQEAVKLARYCAHEMGTQHLLLDNLTKIVSADNEHAEQQRRFTAQLHRTAIDTGMHVHLVAHTRKPPGGDDEAKPGGRYEIAGSRTIVDQPDNVCVIWRDRRKAISADAGTLGAIDDADKPDVVVRVDKQRWGSGWLGLLPLWMDKGCFRFVESVGERAARYARG